VKICGTVDLRFVYRVEEEGPLPGSLSPRLKELIVGQRKWESLTRGNQFIQSKEERELAFAGKRGLVSHLPCFPASGLAENHDEPVF
jgi:hypothetical protein